MSVVGGSAHMVRWSGVFTDLLPWRLCFRVAQALLWWGSLGVLGCYQEPGAQGLWARSLARVWWMVSCPLLPRSSLLLWSSCPAAMGDLSSFCFAGHAVIIVTCSLFSALGGLRTARVSWAFLCVVLAPRGRVAAFNPLHQVLSWQMHTHFVCFCCYFSVSWFGLIVFCYKCSNWWPVVFYLYLVLYCYVYSLFFSFFLFFLFSLLFSYAWQLCILTLHIYKIIKNK